MATNGVVGSVTTLTNDEAIDWLMGDVKCLPGWNATPPPAGWFHNESAVRRQAAALLVKLDSGDAGRPSLKQVFADGYRIARITKGFHQRENSFSFVLKRSAEFCHLTVQLWKAQKYKTIHIYVTASGEFAGATLWDVDANQPIS
jgi:hypothetical protein